MPGLLTCATTATQARPHMDIGDLLTAEAELRSAMLSSDVERLESLLSPRLLFVGLDGHALSRDQDIELHRAGRLRLTVLDTDVEVAAVHEGLAVTVVHANVAGTLDGMPFEGHFVYTRTWERVAERWQVVSAVCRRAD